MSSFADQEATAALTPFEAVRRFPLVDAGLVLRALSVEPTPPTDWESRLCEAQSRIYDDLEKATSLDDYYRARILMVASPLFTIPALQETIEDTTLQSGLEGIQHSYVEIISEIDDVLSDQAYARHHDNLYGLANELVCMTAMTDISTVKDLGRIALPALVWEDKPDIAARIPAFADKKQPAIDFTLTSLEGDSPHGVQVKSAYCREVLGNASRRSSKLCEQNGVTVLYCGQLMNTLTDTRSNRLFSVATTEDHSQRSRIFSAMRGLINTRVEATISRSQAA